MYTDDEPASRKLSFAISGFADSLVPGRFVFFALAAGMAVVAKRKGGAVGVFGEGLGDGCRWSSLSTFGVEIVGARVW